MSKKEFNAPYGNGYFTIEENNGKYCFSIYKDENDTEPDLLLGDDYEKLCEMLADYYF